MSASFASSAKRHRRDAIHLAEHFRHQNAMHLIGLAAECVVKAALERAGIDIDTNKAYRTHFPELGLRIRLLGHTRHMAPLLLILCEKSFLADWRIESRYDEDKTDEDAALSCARNISDVNRLFFATGFY